MVVLKSYKPQVDYVENTNTYYINFCPNMNVFYSQDYTGCQWKVVD